MLTFSVRAVLGVGFSVFAGNALAFLLLTLLFYSPVFVLVAVGLHGERSFLDDGTIAIWLLAIFGLGILMVNIAAPAVMASVVDQLRGRRTSLRKSLMRGVARVPAVIGVAVVTGFLLALGVYTYILPGLMVVTILWVAVPAAVIEGAGVGASIKRSDRLTNGVRWQILGVVGQT
ncbi:MAG: hypothetical protein CSA66_07135 [Proteobacteria bacterium]|nr:MAG: hypothetical protein CSA66_07135 [Pseudomonadota bacterium]